MNNRQDLETEEIPAATLVVFRQPDPAHPPEILMVVRSRELIFAGGAAVFPGGRVDPADHELAAQLAAADTTRVDDLAHRIAAIRETLEETGLAVGLTGSLDAQIAKQARDMLLERGELAPVLTEFGLAIDLDALVPFARWLPRGMKHDRIFDTRFFLADLGTGAVDVAVDETENTRLFWTRADKALQMADDGDISLIFPTRRNLERLAQFESFAAARHHAETMPVRIIIPTIRGEGNDRRLCIPEDAGYPVTSEALASAVRS